MNMSGLSVLIERVSPQSEHWQPERMLANLEDERQRQVEWAEQELEQQSQQPQQGEQSKPRKGMWGAFTGIRNSIMAKMVTKVPLIFKISQL